MIRHRTGMPRFRKKIYSSKSDYRSINAHITDETCMNKGISLYMRCDDDCRTVIYHKRINRTGVPNQLIQLAKRKYIAPADQFNTEPKDIYFPSTVHLGRRNMLYARIDDK